MSHIPEGRVPSMLECTRGHKSEVILNGDQVPVHFLLLATEIQRGRFHEGRDQLPYTELWEDYKLYYTDWHEVLHGRKEGDDDEA